jgi:hypothetical protein
MVVELIIKKGKEKGGKGNEKEGERKRKEKEKKEKRVGERKSSCHLTSDNGPTIRGKTNSIL